jgi:hypothetical protein
MMNLTFKSAVKLTEGRTHFPIFPVHFPFGLTIDGLERLIERLVDKCDAVFLNSDATQAEYDAWNVALNVWVKDMEREFKL